MKERPILMSGPMVRAILEGRKSMTRRVIKNQPTVPVTGAQLDTNPKAPNWWHWNMVGGNIFAGIGFCPYGVVGDRLWVRETWQPYVRGDGTADGYEDRIIYTADKSERVISLDHSEQFNAIADNGYHVRPSIFMPRWASRITLEITDIRVQRLQAINQDDIWAEGIFVHKTCRDITPDEQMFNYSRILFKQLWDSINGDKHPWQSNPWVWALSFKRVSP